MTVSGAAEVRSLRADIRHWRRGRANAKLVDVLGDLYVGVFAALMLGAMAGSVVVHLAHLSDDLCTSTGCREGRTALPWLVVVAALVVVVVLARLFGPVFASPGTTSWLLPAPVDRSAVLRPRLLAALAAGLLAAVPAAVGGALAGFGPGPVALIAVAGALLGVTGVGLAALSQGTRGAPALALVPAVVLWAGLLLIAVTAVPLLNAPQRIGALAVVLTIALGVATVFAIIIALRRLPLLRDHDVAPGGTLAPGLSGALATLDLALLYDVLLAHRWRGHLPVRSRRGGPAGAGALIWAELIRVLRSPRSLLTLLAAVVVPYAVTAAGGGRVVIIAAALVGFASGLPLLVSLRVLTRTPGLERMLPFPSAQTRRLALSGPALLMVAYGVAATPALHEALQLPWSTALIDAIAVGLAALAAATRWVTGRPPDYARPMVSTPAGGVPTNLYGSALRGFDVLVLTSAPLLLSPSGGSTISLLLSLAVLGYLTGRR